MKIHRVVPVLPACVAVALVLSACGGSDADTESASQPQDVPASAAPSEPEPTPELSGAELVAQAFGDGKSVKCTLTHEGTPIELFVKRGGLFRVEAQTPAGQSNLVHKDDVVHVWLDKTTQGFKIPTDQSAPAGTGMKMFTPEEIEALPGNENADCELYDGPDSVFELPSNVTFGSLPVGPMGSAP